MKNISRAGSTLVRKMENYLGANGINYCELKKVRADVISMIAESEARGESAESIFPNGGKNFCDEVLKNATKKKWYEYVLSVLAYMAVCFAIVFPFTVIYTRLWPYDGEAVRGVLLDIKATNLLIPFFAALIGGGVSLFTNRYIFTNKKLAALLVLIVLMPVIAVIIIFIVYGALGNANAVVGLNWVALWLTVAAVCALEIVLLYFLSKRNATK